MVPGSRASGSRKAVLRQAKPACVSQITTCKGIIMGRLHSTVRELEVDLMRFCFQKLGVPPPPPDSRPGLRA